MHVVFGPTTVSVYGVGAMSELEKLNKKFSRSYKEENVKVLCSNTMHKNACP